MVRVEVEEPRGATLTAAGVLSLKHQSLEPKFGNHLDPKQKPVF